MTPLEVLKNHYVGKKILPGSQSHANINFVGLEITNIRMEMYEPYFEFEVVNPDGFHETISILPDWNILV